MHVHMDTQPHTWREDTSCDGVIGHCCVNNQATATPPTPHHNTQTHTCTTHDACTAGLLLLVTHSQL